MSYIYKITNQINGKLYIGKTNRTIQERFKEHCRDYLKRGNEKRPLYSAMKKYGIRNFSIESIEECALNEAETREKYWIEFYGSFKYGYNATLGGDGKAYIDRDLVIKTYQELQTIKSVAKQMNIDETTIRNILRDNNIIIRQTPEVNKDKYGITVEMYDKEGKFLRMFASYSEAGQWLIDNNLTGCKLGTIRTHISEVCNGKRKSAAKFVWKKYC